MHLPSSSSGAVLARRHRRHPPFATIVLVVHRHRPSVCQKPAPLPFTRYVSSAKFIRNLPIATSAHLHFTVDQRWTVHPQSSPMMQVQVKCGIQVRKNSCGTTCRVRVIGADTVLKLGAQTPARSSGKLFLTCPQICVVPLNSGGTAGAHHSGKNNIFKITRVKKQGTVDLATSWYSRCSAEYTTKNLKQKPIYCDA